MGFLKNLINKFRQAKAKADEATTDHVANAEVGLIDGKNQLTKIENELHSLRATAMGNVRTRDEAQAHLDKINSLIERMAEKGKESHGKDLEKIKENLATLIAERKLAQTALDDAQSVVDANASAVAQVTKSRDEIKSKLRSGESKLAAQKAKLQAAKATQSIRSSVTTFGNGGFMDDLEALEKKVENEEDKAEVSSEMNGEKSKNVLDRIESDLDSDSPEDEIAALLSSSRKTKK